MTIQTNLDLIWASTGGVTDPGDTKYQTGWISEIPTYQNFNFVLQNHAKNLLVAAEQGYYEWQPEIAYKAGVEVREAGKKYFCITDHTNQQPSLDATNSYWIPGNVLGNAVATAGDAALGVLLKDAGKQVAGLWSGNDITIESIQPLISMTSNGAGKNWLVGNISGEMVMIDVGVTGAPDGRNIALGQAGVYRVYHEGHKPVQSEVADTIATEPQDGKLYARRNGSWEEVNSTTVSTAPPPPVLGTGQGWFNLDDGQFYIDIDDGDSSQWVRANPPMIPQIEAVEVPFDSVSVEGGATDVQGAIEYLHTKAMRKNLLMNGALEINQRGTTFTGLANTFVSDRWFANSEGSNWNSTQTSYDFQGKAPVGNTLQFTCKSDGAYLYFGQRIEDGWKLSGRELTFSCYLSCVPIASGFTEAKNVQFRYRDGLSAPLGGQSKSTGTAAIRDNRLSFTFTPTITQGNFLAVELVFNDAVNDLLVNDYVRVGGFQLEVGPEATEMERSSPSEELDLCQRYYQVNQYESSQNTLALDHVSIFVPFIKEMRASPTLVFTDRAGTVGRVSYTDSGNIGGTIDGGTVDAFVSLDARCARIHKYVNDNGTFRFVSFKYTAEAEL